MREWLERVAVCGEEDNNVFVWEEEVSGQGCGISASGLLPEALFDEVPVFSREFSDVSQCLEPSDFSLLFQCLRSFSDLLPGFCRVLPEQGAPSGFCFGGGNGGNE